MHKAASASREAIFQCVCGPNVGDTGVTFKIFQRLYYCVSPPRVEYWTVRKRCHDLQGFSHRLERIDPTLNVTDIRFLCGLDNHR